MELRAKKIGAFGRIRNIADPEDFDRTVAAPQFFLHFPLGVQQDP